MQYPRNDLDRANTVLQLLGSFWAVIYEGREFVTDICSSKARLALQSQQNLVELVASVSRYNIPVFHRKYWANLTLRESQVLQQSAPALLYRADATTAWTAGVGGNQFGQLVPVAGLRDVITPGLHRAPIIVNRMLQPSVTLIDGIDYVTDKDGISFYENPFENELIPKVELLNSNNEIVDREITLWIYGGEWDLESVYNQFGYALSVYARSSEGYKTLVNALLDATTIGTSGRAQRLALSAAIGVPVVIEAVETVEDIFTTASQLQIITDQNVYTFSPSAVPTVSIGETVIAGDTLTDEFQIYELHRGSDAVPANFEYLSVASNLLHTHYLGGLTFVNDEVSLDVETATNGDIQVSWQLLGPAVDVNRFWAEVRRREQLSGVTLGQLLYTGPGSPTTLTPAMLPSTVNPLKFLIDNVLRANATIVRIRHRAGSPVAAIPLSFEYLRRVQPPHTHLLVLQEFMLSGLVLDPTDVAGLPEPWYSEELYGFDLAQLTTLIDPDSYLTGQVATI